MNGYKKSIDKFKTDILPVCSGLVLQHHVKLSSKNIKSGERTYYQKEFKYRDTYNVGNDYLVSVKLDHKSYLVLTEVNKDSMRRNDIRITNKQRTKLLRSLNKAISWFSEYNEDGDFTSKGFTQTNDGNIMRKNSVFDKCILHEDKYIYLTPDIKDRGDCREIEECITISINTKSNGFKMTRDEIETLYHEICNFDFYTAGLALINYYHVAEFDENTIIMDIQNEDIDNEFGTTFSKGFSNTSYNNSGMEMLKKEQQKNINKKNTW